MTYFDDLVIDRTKELPSVDGEGARRLMYMLKHAINGGAMVLVDGGEVVSASSELTDLLGYTTGDLQGDWQSIFHPEDWENVVLPHEQNNLAAPYGARIKKKDKENFKWYAVEGLTVVLENRKFRCLIVEET